MTSARRLLIVAGIWELAMAWASSFFGAWFWQVHSGLSAIIIYYLIWFTLMGVVFAWGATMHRHGLHHNRVRRTGILVAMIYLALLAILGPQSRTIIWLIAVLTGISSGLYWLSLYAGATEAIAKNHADWYNAWIGLLENAFAILGPPTAAGIVLTFPSGIGYRVIFGVATAILIGAWALSSDGPKPAGEILHPSTPVVLPHGAWRTIRWSMAALGFRDGLLFFVPGLYLFIETHNPLWLGWYLSVTAGVQATVFWLFSRYNVVMSRRTLWWVGLIVSSVAGLPLFFAPSISAIFILGILIGASYPFYKVRIEGFVLVTIQDASTHPSDRLRLTSAKELWLNAGRVASFLTLVLILVALHSPLRSLKITLALWPLTTMLVYFAARHIHSAPSDALIPQSGE